MIEAGQPSIETCTTLPDWLARLEARHTGQPIQLGLERVSTVWTKLGAPALGGWVVSVAGTNGKGSTVAFLEAMLRAAGHSVACYTSPHLLDFRERLRLNDRWFESELWCRALRDVEHARGEIVLTFFEHVTLAAFVMIAEATRAGDVDVAVLEIGMGGRLDAVNVVDPDASIITSIGLDHQAFLGSDRESIGAEKAGVMRKGKPAIYADREPVASIADRAAVIGADLWLIERDFQCGRQGEGFTLSMPGFSCGLPQPSLSAPIQLQNAAASAALLYRLRERWRFSIGALAQGVRSASVAGRLQRVCAQPEVWLDVAHNVEAVEMLVEWLHERHAALPQAAVRCHWIFGALLDKNVRGMMQRMRPFVDTLWLVDLTAFSVRGWSSAALSPMASELGYSVVDCGGSVASALAGAKAHADRDAGIVLVAGSFVLLEQVMRHLLPEAQQ